VRNPTWRPRVLLPPDSVRDGLFSHAIARRQGARAVRTLSNDIRNWTPDDTKNWTPEMR
jgi:hypothetical protein